MIVSLDTEESPRAEGNWGGKLVLRDEEWVRGPSMFNLSDTGRWTYPVG